MNVDPLTGHLPAHRLAVASTPIYNEVVADLGIPGLDEPATPGRIVVVEPEQQVAS